MPHKNYDAETKANALKELDNGKTMSDVAKAIGAAPNTVAYWKKQAEKKAQKAPKAKANRRKIGAKRATKARRPTQKPVSALDGLNEVIVVAKLIEALAPTDKHLLGEWLKVHPLE